MPDATTARPIATMDLERRFQALSDGKRLRILELLCEGERCVCELADELEVSQPLLSFHLKTLREAELVLDRRDGRWVYYALNAEALDELRTHLGILRPRQVVGRCC